MLPKPVLLHSLYLRKEPTAIIDSLLESASEHSLEEEISRPVSVDLPESNKPVLPPEQDLPESDKLVPEKQNLPGHSVDPPCPVSAEVPLIEHIEESAHSETVSEPPNFDPNSVDSKTVPRRSVRQRLPPSN